jgi:mono/diheme cytochrome c family protein
MKFIKSVFIFTTIAFIAAACSETKTADTNIAANTIIVANSTAQPTAPPDEFARSREIYAESCANCHGAGGAGGEGLFEGKKVKVPSFQSKGAMNASDDNLYRHIADGEEDEMPAFKNDLTEAEMRNLVRFIRREFQKK